MGRPGVTYQDVANAAEEIQAKGINPTIEEIRRLLGTGSSSTIAPYLRKWKAHQDETQALVTKEKLPPELVALMKGLWNHLIDQADAKIAETEGRHQTVMSELQEQHLTLQKEQGALTAAHDALQQEKAALLQLKEEHEQKWNELTQANAVLQNNVLYAGQQLTEKNERITELVHLHKQAQENLEHYREAAREQRLLDQQKNEQQHAQLAQTIEQLQQRLLMADADKTTLKNQLQKIEQKYDALEHTRVEMQAELKVLNKQVNEVEKARDESLQAVKHHLATIQLLQQKLDDKARLVLKNDEDVARLTTALNTSLEHAKALTAERALLLKENAKLAAKLTQQVERVE